MRAVSSGLLLLLLPSGKNQPYLSLGSLRLLWCDTAFIFVLNR